MTRKLIGSAQIGERGMLYFHQEDQWVYPTVSIDSDNGEDARISMQHMPTKLIHKLADEIKRIAFALEKQTAEKR